ncbi:MAG: hypothetical protein AAFU57_13620 [Bacteroidota bacterium]
MMYTFATCTSFLSVFCLYSLSDRVEHQKGNAMLWLAERKKVALMLSGLLCLSGTLILCHYTSLVIGLLAGMFIWLTMASLFLLLRPFNKINFIHVAFLCALMGILEYYIQ